MARNKFDEDERLSQNFNIKHLLRCVKYMKPYKWYFVLAIVLNSVAIVLTLNAPKLIKQALDVAVPSKDVKQLFYIALGLMGIYISSSFLVSRKGKITNKIGQNVIYEIRKELFTHLQQLSFNYYDERPHGKILVRVVNYVNSVSEALSNGIIDLVLDLINLVLILIFMFMMDYSLTLICLAGMPFVITFLFYIKPKQRRAWQTHSNKSSNLNAYINESINGVKITQLFARENKNEQIMDGLNNDYRKSYYNGVAISNSVWVVVANITEIVVAAMYIVGAKWIVPMVSMGTMVAMISYAKRFWQPISNMAQLYNMFINATAYLERIFEAMDEPVLIHNDADAYDLPPIEGNIKFENVTFSYDNKTNILENLSFDVKKGESIALVGETGAGKTTIVNLISRFYDIAGGKITIDGHDITKVTLKSLRSQMGIMLQDSFIFNGTIADNIRYGKLDATQEEIEYAAKAVGAHEFISAFKEGYNTMVKENSSVLSHGEKQLIAFARTFISNPKILILDEATSAIDTKTEKLVQKGINTLLKGRTSFVVAHRLSTIRGCDKIMYIANKGIMECGSHSELMDKKGLYYQLYMSQVEE